MGADIKKIRLGLDLTQQEFAEKLGVTQTLISKIESEKSEPTIRMLRKISKTFDIDLVYLILDEEKEENLQDFANDNSGNPYRSNKKRNSEANEDWIKIIDRLILSLEAKDSQIDKLLDSVQQLSTALAKRG